MGKFLRSFVRNSKGATAVEYGLILGLIVVAIIAALTLFAGRTISLWNNVADVVSKA